MQQTRGEVPLRLRTSIKEALKLWHRNPGPGSPLQELELVQQALDQGAENVHQAVNQVLQQALEYLETEDQVSAQLVRLRFLEKRTVYQVAGDLHIAEPTVYKYQREAIGRLATILHEKESHFLALRTRVLEQRLPPSTYTRLVGVHDQVERLSNLIAEPSPPWLIALEGLGGLGKTALADALIRKVILERSFPDIGWVSAQQKLFDFSGVIRSVLDPALKASDLLRALAEQLLPQSSQWEAPNDPRQALQARLRQKPFLIVIDNLETVSDVKQLLPVLRQLANPTKFLITSRESLRSEADIYHYQVPELSQRDALQLVREEAALRNLADLIDAYDASLLPIYETVGGNPLALKLVVGQVFLLPLPHVLDHLKAAQGRHAEELYHFIYSAAWQQLDPDAREVLALLPLFSQAGATLETIERVSDIRGPALLHALDLLARLSLVNVAGDLTTRRYSIHRLTETFLLNEVIRWQGSAPTA